MASISLPLPHPTTTSAWALPWLTAQRCRAIMIVTIAAVFLGHFAYLRHNCPIDLAEDEAYYWDWSRQLDISYYSKGPLTAWMIRASCAVFGDTMPGVRFPALVMRAGLAVCTWWLTRRLFGSRRLALGAVLLGYTVPMFLAAGLIITTDPPFLFCLGVATCFAAVALFDQKRWAWIALGATVGAGFLVKFSMPVWYVGLLAYLLIDRPSRFWLKTRWPWISLLAAAPFAIPVVLWNIRHGWVTVLHVGEDVGVRDGGFSPRNFLDFWLGQAGVVGPALFVLMMAGVVSALRLRRLRLLAPSIEDDPARGLRFLLSFAMPIFVGVILTSLRKHPSANWAAGSYFPLVILTAHFVARQLRNPRQWVWWRWLFYPAIGSGLALVVAAHNTPALYPALIRLSARYPSLHLSARTDPTYRLQGWTEAGAVISERLRQMPPGTLLLAADYQTTAELAFYAAGQPRTYCAGSYFHDPSIREPFSQYDMWPNRRLDDPALAGRSALYLGRINDDVRNAFATVEQLPPIQVQKNGLPIRDLALWRCSGFKGMTWPGWEGKYNK